MAQNWLNITPSQGSKSEEAVKIKISVAEGTEKDSKATVFFKAGNAIRRIKIKVV